MIAIYVKLKGARKFQPLDASSGTLTDRRMYMTMWKEEHRANAEKIAQEIRDQQAGAVVELRPVS